MVVNCGAALGGELDPSRSIHKDPLSRFSTAAMWAFSNFATFHAR